MIRDIIESRVFRKGRFFLATATNFMVSILAGKDPAHISGRWVDT